MTANTPISFMKGNTWQIAAIAVFVAVIALAGASATQSGGIATTTTETHTIDYNQNSQVHEPSDDNLKAYNETITVEANGSTLTDGADYEWYSSNGTINWVNTTATSDGDTASVTYGYEAYRDSTSTIQTLTQGLNPLVGLSFFVVLVGAAWRIAHSGGGF